MALTKLPPPKKCTSGEDIVPSSPMQMPFMISGASGDIGATLVRYLRSQGKPIYALFSKQESLNSLKSRIGVSLNPNEYRIADLMDEDTMKGELRRASVFYHLAAVVGLENNTETFPYNLLINGILPLSLIKWAEQENPDLWFIFASSRRVYEIESRGDVQAWIKKAFEIIENHPNLSLSMGGSQILGKITEQVINENPLPQGVFPYELSKLLAERGLEQSKLKRYRIVRISNVYGPGTLSGRLAQRAIEARFAQGTCPLPNETRDYIYVDDAAEILGKATGCIGESFRARVDLASGNLTESEKLWELILKHTPEAAGRIDLGEKRPEPTRQDPDWGKDVLGREFTRLETGLRNQIDDFRHRKTQGLTLVIDAGGTHTRFGIWDGKEKKLIGVRKFKTVNYLHPCAVGKPIKERQELWIRKIGRIIQPYIQTNPCLARISLAFAGPVDENGNLRGSSVIWGKGSNSVPLKKLAEAWGLPVERVVNDLTAAVVRYGKGEKFSDLRSIAVVTVSSGIGAKIFDVHNQRVVIDPKGRAGEIGHIIVDPSSNVAWNEGIKGELNAYASGRGMANLARHLASQKNLKNGYQGSVLQQRLAASGLNIHSISLDALAKDLMQSILAKDPFSLDVLNKGISFLAGVLNSFILQHAPDAIVLVGGVIEQLGENYRKQLVDELTRRGVYGYEDEEVDDLFRLGYPDGEDGLRGVGLLSDDFPQEKTTDKFIPAIKGRVQWATDEKMGSFLVAFAPPKINFRNYFIEDQDIFDPNNVFLKEILGQGTAILVIEEQLGEPTIKRIEQYFEKCKPPVPCVHCVPGKGGEKVKDLQYLEGLIELAQDPSKGKDIQGPLNRKGVFVAVGGGCLMDVVGMAASMYRRGIDYIRVPTTLLGQVDAAVGVKVGINYRGAKNFLGAFYPPSAVITDTQFLTTLSDREIRNGIAEIIKIALVSNPSLFETLEKSGQQFVRTKTMTGLVKLVKDAAYELLTHLQQDFFEDNLMRHVDFGHVVAHKFESLSHFELAHGEAVAIDMLFSAYIAKQRGLLSQEDFDRIRALHARIGFPFFHPALSPSQVWKGIQESAEHKGGQLIMVVPRNIGRTVFIDNLNKEEMKAALVYLSEQQKSACPAHQPMRNPPTLTLLSSYAKYVPYKVGFTREMETALSDLVPGELEMMFNIAENPLDPSGLKKDAFAILHSDSAPIVVEASGAKLKFKNYPESFIRQPDGSYRTEGSVTLCSTEDISKKFAEIRAFLLDLDDLIASPGTVVEQAVINGFVQILEHGRSIAFTTWRHFQEQDWEYLSPGRDIGVIRTLLEHPRFQSSWLPQLTLFTVGSTHKFVFSEVEGRRLPKEDRSFFERHRAEKIFDASEIELVNAIAGVMYEVDRDWASLLNLGTVDSTREDFERTKVVRDSNAVIYRSHYPTQEEPAWKLRILVGEVKKQLEKLLENENFNLLLFRVNPRRHGVVVAKRGNHLFDAVNDLGRKAGGINRVAYVTGQEVTDIIEDLLERWEDLPILLLATPRRSAPGVFQWEMFCDLNAPERLAKLLGGLKW